MEKQQKKIFKFIFSAVLGKTLEKINLNIFFLLFFGKMVEKKNLNIFFLPSHLHHRKIMFT